MTYAGHFLLLTCVHGQLLLDNNSVAVLVCRYLNSGRLVRTLTLVRDYRTNSLSDTLSSWLSRLQLFHS